MGWRRRLRRSRMKLPRRRRRRRWAGGGWRPRWPRKTPAAAGGAGQRLMAADDSGAGSAERPKRPMTGARWAAAALMLLAVLLGAAAVGNAAGQCWGCPWVCSAGERWDSGRVCSAGEREDEVCSAGERGTAGKVERGYDGGSAVTAALIGDPPIYSCSSAIAAPRRVRRVPSRSAAHRGRRSLLRCLPTKPARGRKREPGGNCTPRPQPPQRGLSLVSSP